jgi:hypothetical protein
VSAGTPTAWILQPERRVSLRVTRSGATLDDCAFRHKAHRVNLKGMDMRPIKGKLAAPINFVLSIIRYPRRKLMRAAVRAIIGLLLPVALVLSASAYAESGNNKNVAPAAGIKYVKVPFVRIKDFEALEKKYPFLKDYIESVMSANQVEMERETNQVEIANGREPIYLSKLYVSELYRKQQSRLLVVALEGMVCGAGHGCPLGIYIDKGSGYKADLTLSPDEATAVYVSAPQERTN